MLPCQIAAFKIKDRQTQLSANLNFFYLSSFADTTQKDSLDFDRRYHTLDQELCVSLGIHPFSSQIIPQHPILVFQDGGT